MKTREDFGEWFCTFIFLVVVVVFVTLCSGCTAAATAIPAVLGSGVTLYKSAKESGPKAELVLIKFEVHHDNITVIQEGKTK